jgi:pyridoxal phosphate enzyme (YggS family)
MSLSTTHGSAAGRLADIRAAVREAAAQAGRDGADVDLMAVSKFHPAATVIEVLAAGHRSFGENRVQEAAAKWPALRERFPDVRLHLIGQLQTNKVRQAVELFDAICVVDRDKLARALAGAMPGARPGLRLMVQVNVGREVQKSGVDPDRADAFITHCRDELGLPITGVMCVPPAGADPGPHFRWMRELADRHGLPELSMGMTEDFPAAIESGSTQVRVGRAIFGDRPALPPRDVGTPV